MVSHLHPDHFIDLVPLRHYLRYEFEPPRRVRVLGPSDLGGRLDALHASPGFAAEALQLETLGEGSHRVGELLVEGRLVTHTDESYAVRVAPASGDGPGLVYSGDCGRAEDIAPLVRPGDTLLAEVSFGAGPVPRGVAHLDGPAVGRLASVHAGGARPADPPPDGSRRRSGRRLLPGRVRRAGRDGLAGVAPGGVGQGTPAGAIPGHGSTGVRTDPRPRSMSPSGTATSLRGGALAAPVVIGACAGWPG